MLKSINQTSKEKNNFIEKLKTKRVARKACAGDLVCSSDHYQFNTEELKVTDFREFNAHSWSNSRNEFIVDKCYRIILN